MRTIALLVGLLAVAGLARADDDPEPPSGSTAQRQLKGKWNSVKMLAKGAERPFDSVSYAFEKGKVTYAVGKLASRRRGGVACLCCGGCQLRLRGDRPRPGRARRPGLAGVRQPPILFSAALLPATTLFGRVP